MRILTKITANKELYEKVIIGLLKAGDISFFDIEGENYVALTSFQAAALQKIGVGLEFYRSNKELYSQFPIVPKGTKVTKIEGLKPEAEDPEQLKNFVAGLERKLA